MRVGTVGAACGMAHLACAVDPVDREVLVACHGPSRPRWVMVLMITLLINRHWPDHGGPPCKTCGFAKTQARAIVPDCMRSNHNGGLVKPKFCQVR